MANSAASPTVLFTGLEHAPHAQKILQQIAAELQVRPAQVQTAIDLLDGGATVPFVARYRKEATGALDDAGGATALKWTVAYDREMLSLSPPVAMLQRDSPPA